MNCTEDQFRSILREEAADIAAESVALLWLPDREPTRLSRGRAGTGGPRWRRGLVSLGAAAAVTAIAVAATIMAGESRPPQPSSAAPSLWRGVPAFYFAMRCNGLCGNPPDAVVVDTRREAILAAIRSPRGCQFQYFSAAADDRTFAIGCLELSSRKARLFLARFNPATDRLSVTAMHLPQVQEFAGMALSQDGARIATVSETGWPKPPEVTVHVYSIATGTVRTWSGAGNIEAAGGLSWGPGPLLAFGYQSNLAPGTACSIRLLNVNAPSGSLLGASRVVVPQSLRGSYQYRLGGQFAISGDGATVAATLTRTYRPRSSDTETEFAEFSTSTAPGRLLRQWDPLVTYGESIFWSDLSGNRLVVSYVPGSALGIMTGERYTALPQVPKHTYDFAF
jgi:hypothetical protein